MTQFTVKGVDKDSGFDTEILIHAESEANARTKAELQGMIVTEVVNPAGTTAVAIPPNSVATESQIPRIHVAIDTLPSNTLGIAGFVTSIIGWATCGLHCPIGIILSWIAMSKRPRGMAVAGLIIGGVGIIPMAIMIGISVIAPAVQAAKTTAQQLEAKAIIQEAVDETGIVPSDNQGNALLADLHHEVRYSRLSDTSYTIRLAGGDDIFDTDDDRVLTMVDGRMQ